MSLAGLRGFASLLDRDRREKFLSDSEHLLRHATDATVETLGRDLRETFQFGDNFQRRAIDAAATSVASLSRQKGRNRRNANDPRKREVERGA